MIDIYDTDNSKTGVLSILTFKKHFTRYYIKVYIMAKVNACGIQGDDCTTYYPLSSYFVFFCFKSYINVVVLCL